MDLFEDPYRILFDGQREFYNEKFLKYCLQVQRINNKISKLYESNKILSGHRLYNLQKKKVEYHALLATYYEKVQRIKTWEDFENIGRFCGKLVVSRLEFKLKKKCPYTPSGYSFFWCKLHSSLEAHCSKLFMFKEYEDYFELQICQNFEFEEVYNNLVVTIEVMYLFFPSYIEKIPTKVDRTEVVHGENVTLQLSELPFRRIGHINVTTVGDQFYLSNENVALPLDVPVIAYLNEDSIKVSFKFLENSKVKCLL